jgi:hypothetical protein
MKTTFYPLFPYVNVNILWFSVTEELKCKKASRAFVQWIHNNRQTQTSKARTCPHFQEKFIENSRKNFSFLHLGEREEMFQAAYCVIKGTVARKGKTSMVENWKEQKRKRKKKTAHSFYNFPPSPSIFEIQ